MRFLRPRLQEILGLVLQRSSNNGQVLPRSNSKGYDEGEGRFEVRGAKSVEVFAKRWSRRSRGRAVCKHSAGLCAIPGETSSDGARSGWICAQCHIQAADA